jgi:fido (protein-threonine AMPylation protein)
VVGASSAWRTGRRGHPWAAPPERIEGRLEILEAWLRSDSMARLQPSEAGSLVLARIVEILPFDDGNGRVSRLAAGHAMVSAGGRAPILSGADGARLQACLQAAFALDLQPLAALLDEASERELDVMIQVLEGRV